MLLALQGDGEVHVPLHSPVLVAQVTSGRFVTRPKSGAMGAKASGVRADSDRPRSALPVRHEASQCCVAYEHVSLARSVVVAAVRKIPVGVCCDSLGLFLI